MRYDIPMGSLFSRIFVLAAALGVSPGCQCDEERPYTPFQVATNLPADRPPEDEPEEKPQDFKKTEALRPANPRSSWKVFGRTLQAPAGTRLVSALRLPDPEENEDRIVVWSLAEGPEGAKKQGLWAFDAGGRSQLAGIPDALPSGKDCEAQVGLWQTGPRTVTAEIEMECQGRLLPGTPTRALMVLQPAADEPRLLTLTLRELPPGEHASWEVDTADQDGDGRDDVLARVTLRAPGGGRASASFRWLVRPAGLSRDASEPRQTFEERAKVLQKAAPKRDQAPEVLASISALRRLTFAVCAESKTEVLQVGQEQSLRCGELGKVHARLSLAEVRAHLAEDNPVDALGAFEHANFYFGAPPEDLRNAARNLLLKAIDDAPAKEHVVGSTPSSVDDTYPVGTPLHFDNDGRLWGLDGTGSVVALGDTPTASGGAAATGPDPWARRPRGPGGQMLAAALPSCNRSEVQLSLVRPGGELLPPVPVDILAPRPAKCSSLEAAPLRAVPIDWTRGQLLAIVAGQPVTTGGTRRAGEIPIAWGSALGLAVWDEKGLELWRDTHAELSHCTVRKDKSEAACIRRGKVVRIERPRF